MMKMFTWAQVVFTNQGRPAPREVKVSGFQSGWRCAMCQPNAIMLMSSESLDIRKQLLLLNGRQVEATAPT